ncbi:hypothetical protein AK812_SmicGene31866 [Symbiodinium microadriaticum]|uniref:Uncharacterized protein n=1 Tax=Symbiodinium microadriaticum TaxID=2951 RepID=A0A1Q9CVL8_SYMMI|nr:hypothetical protein AK812_SmicGene31866 [Symbiodinium microadriaticum]
MAVAQPAPRVTRWSARQPELSPKEGSARSLDTALDELPPHEESLPKSTADCWNRLRDKDRVESELGLCETGCSYHYYDDDDDDYAEAAFQLFEKKYALSTEAMLVGAFTNPDKSIGRATAHEQLQKLAAERVDRELVHPQLVSRAEELALIARGYRRIVFGDHGPYVEFEASQIVWENLPEVILKPSHAYYDEYWAEGGFVKLYKQKRSVQHKRNPPTGGVRHDREGGYADYKVGMCYISPSQLTAATRGARASADDARSRRWKK